MKTILFACVHNAGRSQIAAAWFNALSDSKEAQAISAGTQPGNQVHREVITAMKEVSIDLSSARPQLLTEELARGAEVLVTMGCGEACPLIPGVERQDWPIADPKGRSLEAVRRIRDEIYQRVTAMVAERGWRQK
jgi:arsenate reductase (thioredoxin)